MWIQSLAVWVSLEKMEIVQAKSVPVANNKGDMAVSPSWNSEVVPFPFLQVGDSNNNLGL